MPLVDKEEPAPEMVCQEDSFLLFKIPAPDNKKVFEQFLPPSGASFQEIVPGTRETGSMQSATIQQGRLKIPQILVHLSQKYGNVPDFLAVHCEENCAHVRHFLDPTDTWRLIFCRERTIVSIREALPNDRNELFICDLARGSNVYLTSSHVLLVKGGYPFRLCGFIERVQITSVLLGGKTSELSEPVGFSSDEGIGSMPQDINCGMYAVKQYRDGRAFKKRESLHGTRGGENKIDAVSTASDGMNEGTPPVDNSIREGSKKSGGKKKKRVDTNNPGHTVSSENPSRPRRNRRKVDYRALQGESGDEE